MVLLGLGTVLAPLAALACLLLAYRLLRGRHFSSRDPLARGCLWAMIAWAGAMAALGLEAETTRLGGDHTQIGKEIEMSPIVRRLLIYGPAGALYNLVVFALYYVLRQAVADLDVVYLLWQAFFGAVFAIMAVVLIGAHNGRVPAVRQALAWFLGVAVVIGAINASLPSAAAYVYKVYPALGSQGYGQGTPWVLFAVPILLALAGVLIYTRIRATASPSSHAPEWLLGVTLVAGFGLMGLARALLGLRLFFPPGGAVHDPDVLGTVGIVAAYGLARERERPAAAAAETAA